MRGDVPSPSDTTSHAPEELSRSRALPSPRPTGVDTAHFRQRDGFSQDKGCDVVVLRDNTGAPPRTPKSAAGRWSGGCHRTVSRHLVVWRDTTAIGHLPRRSRVRVIHAAYTHRRTGPHRPSGDQVRPGLSRRRALAQSEPADAIAAIRPETELIGDNTAARARCGPVPSSSSNDGCRPLTRLSLALWRCAGERR